TATMMQAIPQQTMIHPGMQQISIQQPDGMLVIQQRGMQQAQIQLIPETNPKLQQPSNQLVEQTDGAHDVDTLIHPGEKIASPIQQQNMVYPEKQQDHQQIPKE